MSLHILDTIFRIPGIRGHIPEHNGFGAGRSESSFAASPLMRVLAAIVVTVAFLSLALWAAVWLTIKLL